MVAGVSSCSSSFLFFHSSSSSSSSEQPGTSRWPEGLHQIVPEFVCDVCAVAAVVVSAVIVVVEDFLLKLNTVLFLSTDTGGGEE